MAGIISKYGFPAEQIERKGRVTAYIEAWRDAPTRNVGTPSEPIMLGGYGVAWAGDGKEDCFYGGGYSRNQEPLLAFGIQRLLEIIAKGSKATIHIHKEFLKYVDPYTGYVRYGMSHDSYGLTRQHTKFHGFKPIAATARALDKERIYLEGHDKLKKGDQSHPPRWTAWSLAHGLARSAITANHASDPLYIPSDAAIVVRG